ncbi:MAG TPA: prephenate dehydrogenase [Clostridiales bacterium]|nr:prephenate dehydrogenase [Clostridiales bacterium]
MKVENIAIVGLGLIGGSIAKALKQNTGYNVLGLDIDPLVCDDAKKDGAVDRIIKPENLSEADLVVLCLAPETAYVFLKDYLKYIKKSAILTDVCGVKRWVVEKFGSMCQNGPVFVGGHPMAGKEKGGYANSDPLLFINASYIITPVESTPTYAVDVVKEFALNIGCKKVTIATPDHHDRMIAFTSQLPHVLAGAYIKSPVSRQHEGYSAGSYCDVSRVAALDEYLWSDLLLKNSDYLSKEIDILINNLSSYRAAISSGNREELISILREGRVLKEEDNKESI